MKKQSSLSSFFSKKKDATVTTETVRKSPRTASKLAASRAAAADKQEENEIYRYPVGTLICKEFDDGWFFGKITEPPFDGRYYTVLYTDGDGETLTHPQAKVAVRAAWLQQNTTPTTTNGDPGLWLDTCLDNTTYSTTSTTSDTTYSSNKNNNSSNKNNNSNVAVYYRYPVGTRLYKEFAAEWFFGTIVEAYIDSDNEEEDKEDSEALDLCSTPSSATATTRRSSTKKVTTVQQQSSSNNNYWYTVTYSDGDAESLSHAAIGPWVHRAEFGAGTTKTPPKRAARSQTPSKRKPSPRRLHVIATATPKRARSQTPSQHKPTPRRRHQQQPPKRSKPKKRQDEDYGADDYHSEEDDISMDGINYEDDDDELEEMNTDDIDDDDDSVSEQSVPKTRSPAKKQTKQQQKVPSQPAMKRSSQPKKGSTTNKKTKTPAAGGAIKVVRRNVNGVVIGYDKAPYEAGNNLPILTDIQEMFDDMVQNKLLGLGSAPTPRSDPLNENAQLLLSMLQTFRHQKANGKNGRRPLRVATMCSGTESPILALDMLEKAIREACDRDERFQSVVSSNETDGINDNQETPAFAVEHVFSCEIEPFKQAYIERNFHPPLLFRDIRELGRDMATTAYGALVPVPGKGTVDLLIAGTSCVDYSNLNNQKASEKVSLFWICVCCSSYYCR